MVAYQVNGFKLVEHRYRIEGRLRREADIVASKLKKPAGSSKKKYFNPKTFSLSIVSSDMVNIGDVKEIECELHEAKNSKKEY